MNVRIEKNVKKNVGSRTIELAGYMITLGETEHTFVIDNGDIQIYLEGEFYYYVENGISNLFGKDNLTKILSELTLRSDPCDFCDSVEGIYCGVWININENTITIFSDKLNRKHLYYYETENSFIASTDLKDIILQIDRIEYNQFALYSYLLLGYTPIFETFYKNISRLSCDETILVSKTGIQHRIERKETNIIQYDKTDMDRYDALISNSIYSRSSNTHNVVMNSGGWDSTTIVSLLLNAHDATKISSIVFEVILSNQKSFNVYEVDKVNRISNYFGIKTDKCIIDYNDKGLIDFWEKNTSILKNTHVYSFFSHHSKLIHQIASQGCDGVSVFNGETADSIHNFGFSQFVSVNYENMFLREYADKCKSYLYGPTFFSALLAGNFSDDKVFQFFKYYYGSEKVDDYTHLSKTELLKEYFHSFVLSYPRIPFAKWQNQSISTPALREEYTNHINKHIFEDIALNSKPETLYYNLLQLYRHYHLQSAQITVNQSALGQYGLTCKMPFLDMQMMKFAAAMPENWGRGLELRTTKYPLRYLASERWKMPLDILEESGPHSYIAENDKKWSYAGGNWTINCEILYNSVFKSYFQDVLRTTRISHYLDEQYFNIGEIQSIIDRYLDGKEDLPNHGLLLRLALLFSIGLF